MAAPDPNTPSSREERVGLVTGGARRVGKACAIALASRGFRVAVHANRSVDRANRLAEALTSEHGVACEAFQADLADEDAARGLVQAVAQRFGRIDALVNSAAVWPEQALEDVTAEDVRQCLNVNTVSVFVLSQAAGLLMAEQAAGGVVINLGDAATAYDGRPYRGYAGYHPSKAAIPGMTRALAVELAHRNARVRVNAVLPGPVLCEGLPDEPEEPAERRRHIRSQALIATDAGDPADPEQACGRAEHVALAVVALIENPFITGACLPVDGGGRLLSP